MPNTPTTPPAEAEALCERLERRVQYYHEKSFDNKSSIYSAMDAILDAILDAKAAALIRQQQAEIERLREALGAIVRARPTVKVPCREDEMAQAYARCLRRHDDLARAALSQEPGRG